jgi:hypothetical protein
MSDQQEVKRRTGSPAGFHFYNLYQNCPRKFMIQKLYRLEPQFLSNALSFGTAFHEAKATFYLTKSLMEAIKVGEAELHASHQYYEHEEVFKRDLLRLPILMEVWVEQRGQDDLKYFDVVAAEYPLEIPIKNTPNFRATMRIDGILQSKEDDMVYLMETKTSSFSEKQTIADVRMGDQATMYLWGVKRAHPDWRIGGVIPDVAYWHKSQWKHDKELKYDKIKCIMGDVIHRSDTQLDEFEHGLAGIFTEISQKVKAWHMKAAPETMLFPRNTQWCNSYMRPCEYADICRHRISMDKVPFGFVRRESEDNFFNQGGELRANEETKSVSTPIANKRKYTVSNPDIW